QRTRHAGRRLYLPRLFHRSLPGRGARQVRVQRSQSAKGRHPQGYSARLLGGPHRFDCQAFHGARRPGAGSGQLQHRRCRFQGDPDAIAGLAYDAVKVLTDAMTRAASTDGPKVRDALAKTDLPGVTGRIKINEQRNVDKPAVIQEVTYGNGDVKFVYKTTINP